jgi:hypothetical protein
MIFVDTDGVLVDFYGTAKKFEIDLKLNEFGKWKWSYDDQIKKISYPTPEEFYAKAELQPWAVQILSEILIASSSNVAVITRDYAEIKRSMVVSKTSIPEYGLSPFAKWRFIEAPTKSRHCLYPVDLLIDDNIYECEEWQKKGGIAYHFDLASDSPFEKFIKWWRK